MGRETPELFVVGIDGAAPALIERWVAEGHLPTLGRLMDSGCYGMLRSTIPPLSPTAWSSFATGKNPGKHGVFDHVRRREGSYTLEPVSARSRHGEPFWRRLSLAGYRVGLINVPVTYPPQPINGFMISGMYTPSKKSRYTFPGELALELDEVLSGYILHSDAGKPDNDEQMQSGLLDSIRNRGKAIRYLLAHHPVDVLVVVFDETDRAQHRFWRYMDPAHPRHSPGSAMESAILEIYQAIDCELKEILKRFNQDATLIVMSDHGFGPLYKNVYLNNWLLARGYLRLKNQYSIRLKAALYRAGFTPTNALAAMGKLKLGLPARLISAAKKERAASRPNQLRRLLLSSHDVNWSKTTAYLLGGQPAGIFINLEGREPRGPVRPGTEYDLIRGRVIEGLKKITDPDTGDNVFAEVFPAEAVYSGDHVHQAPDIVFLTYEDRYVVRGAQDYMFATSSVLDVPRWPPESGSHSRDGIILINGPDIQKNQRISGAEITDLAPTILYLMNLEIPDDYDGRVLADVWDQDRIETNPIRFGPPSRGTAGVEQEYSPSEKQEIINRLRSLGYFG